MHTNLASILRQADIISEEHERAIVEYIESSGGSVPGAILALDILPSFELTQHIAEIFGLSVIETNQYDYPQLCEQLGLRDLITRYNALPVESTNNTLFIALSDPTVVEAEEEFRFATNQQVEILLCDERELTSCIRRMYGKNRVESETGGKEITQDELANLVQISDDEFESVEDLSQDDAPVSRFIHQVLLDAVRKGASDIHFEPYEDTYRIRMRCDGILIQANSPAPQLGRRLAARLKILSKLDIAERRLPQDGRIKLRLSEKAAIDLRVSTLPTLWGEKVVLRLLDSSSANLNIDMLGYSAEQKALYLEALRRPQGMILMTGPTGSGKTVSLYTGLSILNTVERNISTAEDPVEINLAGINQVQVSPKIGFTFAAALKSFLRQDPDIVMLGEIRDFETAEIAIKAAQTGHLVLSTLHTNSAAETVIRLGNMGVEPYNLASSLSLIIAQRLARRLCSHCKQPHQLPSAVLEKHLIPEDTTIYRASEEGCADCNAGYSGRIGIYEVMPFDADMQQAISHKASIVEIESLAVKNGMKTLGQSGIEILKQGVTSYQELQRVLYL
ncbi:Type IV pilus assembly protein tapB [Vibrio nigripulchritudo MADA3029]|uniref:type IV-A pilus assembly ATPase PilB n=1 Tax=Vibrio nigripulchritudo TaxID=28173 RepID=UPI0003B19D62|nr:type IV-A pilus assembly ATPase PilB [Vibrio nigripulchritudo]CCN46912.1 Type IV pilus assembly protein tapB [Vibrio nigripulchritudo MADA3020]CCN51671.1 Type IV pilus assembly protein tapB [Vibrio nigripulchritudo MADA3021]CCN57277.1 Type IV pilus assembly protein tapB [Vibrio nigripulchritudo MADA3029]